MKRMIVGLLSVCLLGSLTVLAGEKAVAEKAVKKDAALQEITATGKLAKSTTGFSVTEADGTVVTVKVAAKSAAKSVAKKDDVKDAAKEGEAAAVVDLEKFIGKNVKVVGMGTSKTGKDGKKTVVIKSVTKAEEVAAPAAAEAAAAPAAAAPAAEVPAAPAK